MSNDPAGPTGPDRDDVTDVDRVDAEVDEVRTADTAMPRSGADEASALQRVHALADESIPDDVRARHLLAIRTFEPAGAAGAASDGRGVIGRGRRIRRRAVALATGAAALLVLTGGTTVAAAAQSAQPDDALYNVKRATEQAWLAMPRGSERAAEVHLALADRRMGEMRRAPEHAERLVSDGMQNIEAAASDRPEDAIDSFERLLGGGPDALPAQASPMARAALHRNCMRLADRHGITGRCGPAPDVDHPGRGQGLREGDHPGRGQGPGDGAHPGRGQGFGDGQHPGRGDRDAAGSAAQGQSRGWGPGGRPPGEVGPPPGTPGRGNTDGAGPGRGDRGDDAPTIEELDDVEPVEPDDLAPDVETQDKETPLTPQDDDASDDEEQPEQQE